MYSSPVRPGTSARPSSLSCSAAGHQVVGLARSDRSAAALKAAGAEVWRGDLDDLDGLRAAAAAADGVIHLAFKHEAMASGDYRGAIAADLPAIEAMGAALAGTGKPFVGTGGTLMLALGGVKGRPGTEQDALGRRPAGGRREHSDRARRARRALGRHPPVAARAQLARPPRLRPSLIGIARDAGVSGYVGDGANRWPAVHTLDAARLYLLALESAPAGSRLHGVADEGVPFRDIAEVIGRRLNLPAASIDPQDAGEHFGFLGAIAGLDNPTSNALTRELLGWKPATWDCSTTSPHGHYFDGVTG